MTGQQIGYVRVSTAIQNTDRQLVGVELDRVFTDKASGSSAKRPQLDALLSHIRQNDTVNVHSIDRLARNLADLLSLVKEITGKGVTLKFHKQGLTFTGDGSAMQELQLSIMGAVAQFERAIINERASEGRAQAIQRGVKFGRKPVLSATQVAEARQQHAAGKSIRALAIDFDCGRATISRALRG